MPGGKGGMDLYYCDLCEKDWCEPVNMGVSVNSPGNESFPWADPYGKVFFASDGHGGQGGKDLFFTVENDGGWISPVPMDSAFNSPGDDFALIMDSTAQNGFFSSDRLYSDDIFSFHTARVEFEHCDTVQENNYCFTLYDEHHPQIDTLPAIYPWDFGNNIIRTGPEVSHCFPGPGNYIVRLDIIDELTGDTINRKVEYHIQLDAIEQDYINAANVGISGRPIPFKSVVSDTEEQITDYLWNFGTGFEPGRAAIEHIFEKQGIYTVRLGIKGTRNACTSRQIRVFNNFQELKAATGTPIQEYQSYVILMNDLAQPEKLAIETLFAGIPFNVSFDPYGITPYSQRFLEKAVKALNDIPELRLEIMVHCFGEYGTASDQLARELGFYFKKKGIEPISFSSRAVEMKSLISSRESNAVNNGKGILEFVFMKRL